MQAAFMTIATLATAALQASGVGLARAFLILGALNLSRWGSSLCLERTASRMSVCFSRRFPPAK
jgi:hypothetical protein